jgi:hypothetical protein
MALAAVTLSACASGVDLKAPSGSAGPLQRQVQALLSRYDLHAAGSGETKRVSFPAPGEEPFVLYARASASIGLDLRGCAGKSVDLLAVPLAQRSQGGAIHAYFVIDGAKVVGAYLVLDEYVPGIVSLSDKREFLPAGLTAEHLTFDGVKSIEITGPWNGDGWGNHATYRTADDVTRLTSLLTASTAERGERSGVEGDEEYMLLMHYADGAVIRVRLVTKRGTRDTFVTFDTDPLWEWHYLPPASLKVEVKSALAAV